MAAGRLVGRGSWKGKETLGPRVLGWEEGLMENLLEDQGMRERRHLSAWEQVDRQWGREGRSWAEHLLDASRASGRQLLWEQERSRWREIFS